jgi:hypothetical protein
MTEQKIKRIKEDNSNIKEYSIDENGVGYIIYINLSKYEGKIKNNVREGDGKMTYPNGNIYEGKFKNDVKEGVGKMIYSNGYIYEGEFKNNKNNGKLIIYTKKKIIFEGTINENQELTGNLNCEYESGEAYIGPINKNLREGHGTLKYKDLRLYEGEFQNDKFNGIGKLTTNEIDENGNTNDEIYEGEFKNNMFNGPGKLTRTGKYNGHSFVENYEGHWSDNNFISKYQFEKINRLEWENSYLEDKVGKLESEIKIKPGNYLDYGW